MNGAYDVIVVGGGVSGGLPAACYLQKAGLEVLIVEANGELGTFCCTHETWPQTLDSPHVGVSFAGNSPVIEDLDLERYGFRFRASPVILGTTDPDGTNCLICQDPERTAQSFAKRSERDGERMLGIQERVHATLVEFNELCLLLAAPGPLQARPGVRDLRLRDGLLGGGDVGDDRPGAVRAHLRVGRLPADPDDPGRVLGARRAVRPRPGRLRRDLRALLHDRDRARRQRGADRCADPLLSRARRRDPAPTAPSSRS